MQRLSFCCLLVLALLLAACQSAENPAPQPTTPPPSVNGEAAIVQPVRDKTIVVGNVLDAATNEPLTETVVILGEVFREGEAGGFMVDAANSPTTITDLEGKFAFPAVDPKEYIIVVGDIYGANEIIEDPFTEQAATWIAEPNEVLDVGTLIVDLSQQVPLPTPTP